VSQNFISSEALAELDEIFDYFATRSVEAGEKFVSEFKKKC
jgi:toxin ParE1/3/4